MSGQEVTFHLYQPFPSIELSYPEYVVRTAIDEDVEKDFLEILSDAFGPPAMTHDLFLLDLDEGWYTRGDCLVLYNDKIPLAAGQVRVEESDADSIGFLDTLGVPKAYQNHGYGIEMTKRRIIALVERGVTEIRSEVEADNHQMQTILQKLGFATKAT